MSEYKINFNKYIDLINTQDVNNDLSENAQKFIAYCLCYSQIWEKEINEEIQKCIADINKFSLKDKIEGIEDFQHVENICLKIYNLELNESLGYVTAQQKMQLYFMLNNKNEFSKEIVIMYLDKLNKQEIDHQEQIQQFNQVKQTPVETQINETQVNDKRKFWIQIILSFIILSTIFAIWFYVQQYIHIFEIFQNQLKSTNTFPSFDKFKEIIEKKGLTIEVSMLSKIMFNQLICAIILLFLNFKWKLKSTLIIWTSICLFLSIFISIIGAIATLVLAIITLVKFNKKYKNVKKSQ